FSVASSRPSRSFASSREIVPAVAASARRSYRAAVMRARSLLLFASLAAGCAPPAPERAVGWQVARDGPLCMALHQGRAEWIAIDLTRIPANDSGIRILAAPLGGVDAAPLPGYTLSAAGAPVRGRNFGGHTRGALRGIKFFFNPRPLLRRHPAGFRLAVQRDGAEVYA